jgi:protein SCO1/2
MLRSSAARHLLEALVNPVRARGSFAVLSAVLLAGCGMPGGLHGLHRAAPTLVGGASVTELRRDGTSAPFFFRAEPGHLLTVFFGYANCPDVCPTTMLDLRRALGRLGPDSARVATAFVTVDPRRDTAAVLLPFLDSFVSGTHALRPESQEQLAGAERAFGATSAITRHSDGEVDVSHTGALYVVDAGGHVLVEWDYGTKPADMASDLAQLLKLQAATR